jgi:CheY-like chemotaxis protein
MNSSTSAPRLLVVEDNADRIELFKQWIPDHVRVTWALSAGRAMRIVELDAGKVYQGILLDFDLGDQKANPDEAGLSGRDVAKRVARHIDPEVPILIHSINRAGARAMERILEPAGFDVVRAPFTVLTEARLRRWIETLPDL